MESPLLPQGNDLKRNILCILLCAGEGTRIRSYINEIPKPLISISDNEYNPILLDTIIKLQNFKIKTILIITGHLNQKIEEFTNALIKKTPDLKNKVKLLDSHLEYQKGPLYSFLSILPYNQYFSEDLIYFLLPGDTIFDTELLKEIYNHSYELKAESKTNCIVFYRKIRIDSLLEIYSNSVNDSTIKISIAKVKDKYNRKLLTKIIQVDISSISKKQTVFQIIPCFLFTYKFITNIKTKSMKSNVNTLTDAINLLLKRNYAIRLVEIKPELKFYDIDTYHSLNYLKRVKKVDNSSSENL